MRTVLCFLCFIGLLGVGVSSVQAQERLRMSTTTSTEDSGLLAVLLPPFEKANNIKVDVISVGTGAALKLGENGDVDVVLVHSRAAEDKFVQAGYGIDRKDVMYNDFIVVGPEKDPAKIKSCKTAVEAFKRLGEGKAEFVSRGDDSGTHKKEMEIWKAAGIKPEGKWYLQAGQGMGAVLQMASNKQAYTLADRGTYISMESKIKLPILFEGDKLLQNPYGIIAVNPAKYPKVNYQAAKKLIDYMTGSEGQKIIADFKKNGKQFFFPNAVK